MFMMFIVFMTLTPTAGQPKGEINNTRHAGSIRRTRRVFVVPQSEMQNGAGCLDKNLSPITMHYGDIIPACARGGIPRHPLRLDAGK